LLDALPHDANVDELTIGGLEVIASEADGDRATGTVDMTVTDAQPENSLGGDEEATEGGETIEGTWEATQGADGATTTVEIGGNSYALDEAIDTGSGELTVDSGGTWSFVPGTNAENTGFDFELVTLDSDGDEARATHTVTVDDGAGPTPGDSDGEGKTLSLNLADAATEDGATDSTDGELAFTAGSDDITEFAFGDPANLTVDGLDGDLNWTTDGDGNLVGNLVGSLDGDDVLKLSLNGGPIGAQTSGTVTVTAELLDALPHDANVDELTIGGLEVIASEADGDRASGTVDVTVTDAQPENTLGGDKEATEGGVAIDGTWSEEAGADGVGSTTVEFGGESYALDEAIDTGSGELTVNSDGTWSFVPGTNAENTGFDFELVTLDSDGDEARSTHTVSVVDGAGPTPGDSDGEGATLSL
ncbi:hypothetical protein SAMN05443545_1191, partial [Aidingimonas halophila]